MTQEQKDLLLKDLCARLPYDVKVNCNDKVYNFNGIQYFNICTLTDDNENNAFTTAGIKYIKPYLFPLSSITEEQYYELQNVSGEDCLDHMEMIKSLRECTDFTHWPLYEYRVIDWFHKNHFDYRGLIPMGLAIDATGLDIY